eukprot:GHVU01004694.1.p1 GENE.GHVU01004694.1~~GHVU01004694.1.p1  ORF type:complete len:101 (-),score=14.75 GHVU01004694.1:619-921(-)
MRNFSLPSALLPHRVEETDQRELAAMHPPVEEAAKLKEAQVPLPGLTQSAPEEEHRDYHPKVMNDSDGEFKHALNGRVFKLYTEDRLAHIIDSVEPKEID